MSENKQEIRNKINEILNNDDLDLKKKSLEIFNLTDKISPQVGFEFLDIYSEKYTESNPERMSSSDISRILSASFPFGVPEFLKFVGEDNNRLVEFTEVTKKFIKSFPFSYMEVMKIYHLPALAASYFYGDTESRRFFQGLRGDISAHHYGTLMSAAILTNRNEALSEIVNSMPPNLLTPHVLFEIIDAKNYNWKVVSSIIDKLHLNFDEKVSYKSQVNMTFPVFLAYKAVSTSDKPCFELFDNLVQNYAQGFSVIATKEIVNFVATHKQNRSGCVKILEKMLDTPNLSVPTFTSIIDLIVNNKEVREHVDIHFVEKILNSELLSSQYVDKITLMKNIVNTMLAPGVTNIESSHVDVVKTMLEKLVEKYPSEFENVDIFQLWSENNEDFPNSSPKFASWVKKDLVNKLEYFQKNWSLTDGEGKKIFKAPLGFDNYVEFLKENGFLVSRTVESTTGGFFNKKTVVETILEWDEKAVKERSKYGEGAKRESLSFLTTDSGEAMDLLLIKTLPNKQLQAVCESLVMMSYQFSNFSNDPLIAVSEESHFLKNNLPKMFNKIVYNYHEYKVFDSDAALDSLTAQLVMLQKKTTKCMTVVIRDAQYDLESDIQATETVLRAPLTAKP